VRGRSTLRNHRRESGIALLIAIFVLLLISVVGIALIVSSGTESALAGNYRSSTGVYYAALAGLEEGRGRLMPKNPDYVLKADASFLPPSGTPLSVGDVRYILNPNPAQGENLGNVLTIYKDLEYFNEFQALPSLTRAPIASVSPNNTQGIQGPLYKWVRINAVSEKSLNVDFDSHPDSTTPVYFDGAHFSNNQSAGPQVLEITSFAILPNGSQKLLQYLVTPSPIQLPPFLAALTLSGSAGSGGATFQAPTKNLSYVVKGDNQDCSGNPTPQGAVHAIGVLNAADALSGSSVLNGIQPGSKTQYTGSSSPAPDVQPVSFPANLQSPSQLDALAQSIAQNADAVITPSPPSTPPYLGTATGADLTPLGMKSGNLLTVVVNGNLDISNWNSDGYGLLLVTGKFTYDPDTNWNGIILVIGQGTVRNLQNGQFKQINGAMLVAKTRDATGTLLSDPPAGGLGGASVKFDDDMQGNGIRYSSCWIQKAQPTASYRILSFREIPQ
jgi:hypothetical protein